MSAARRALAGLALCAAACAPSPPVAAPVAPIAASSPVAQQPPVASTAPAAAAPADARPDLTAEARVAIHEDRLEDALAALQRALAAAPADTPPGARLDAELLLCAVLEPLGRRPEALQRLATLPPCLGRQLLLAVALAFTPGDAPRAEQLAALAPWDASPDDLSLAHLREAWVEPLPSLAAATLACGVADAAAAPGEPQRLRDAAARALQWQALEARAAVDGLQDAPGEAAARRATAEAWARGELPADEALLDVMADDAGALLLLCLPQSGAQVVPLEPSAELDKLATRAVEALRSEPLARVADASAELALALLPPAARELLAPIPRWTLILPDPFLGLPPTAWVMTPPDADHPLRFLVEDHVLRLLPHVPGAPSPPAPAGARWLDVGQPAIAPDGVPAARDAWTARYGPGVLGVAALPPLADATALTGAGATVPALRAALPGSLGLRLGGPGAGAGPLGGVLLAPAAGAAGDEAGGLLTWSRLAQLPLPPVVLCDGTRFEPAEPSTGADLAATALLSRSSDALLARWPEAPTVRQATLRHVTERMTSGETLELALTETLRDWLAKARPSAAEPPLHPRSWAAFLPYRR